MAENPQSQPPDPRPPAGGVWPLLNAALSVAVILLCMFILNKVQRIEARLESAPSPAAASRP